MNTVEAPSTVLIKEGQKVQFKVALLVMGSWHLLIAWTQKIHVFIVRSDLFGNYIEQMFEFIT
jgi:hypothetical protein